MTDLNEFQRRLKSFAETVNAFKSEAVQIRVIDALLGELGMESSAAADTELKPRKARTKKTKATQSGSEKSGKPKEQSKSTRKNSSSPGAYATISQLLDADFFKSGKTIGAIVDHCRTSRGHHYKASECSPPLLRLLRDEKLQRKKNKEGQYEYTQA